MTNEGTEQLEKLRIDELVARHSGDSNFQCQYAQLKEAAFEMYQWGLRTDNDDAIDVYIDFQKVFRRYDSKFLKPAQEHPRTSDTSAEAKAGSPVS